MVGREEERGGGILLELKEEEGWDMHEGGRKIGWY